jgi:hypothetical protein
MPDRTQQKFQPSAGDARGRRRLRPSSTHADDPTAAAVTTDDQILLPMACMIWSAMPADRKSPRFTTTARERRGELWTLLHYWAIYLSLERVCATSAFAWP